jgi:hypothetical protein
MDHTDLGLINATKDIRASTECAECPSGYLACHEYALGLDHYQTGQRFPFLLYHVATVCASSSFMSGHGRMSRSPDWEEVGRAALVCLATCPIMLDG